MALAEKLAYGAGMDMDPESRASWGEAGGRIGEVLISLSPSALDKKELAKRGGLHLRNNLHIRDHAKNLGKDVVVAVTAHGLVLKIGVGIAISATAIGAVVVYKHRRK